jgi:sulfatase maturation enzyme AslB (radical SAM superfamily)
MVGVGFKRIDNKGNKQMSFKDISKEELMESEAFCVIPWIHMHPWPDGRVFTCCLSELHSPVGDLNEEGATLESVWNGPGLKKFRLDMLNHKKLSNCNRCYEQEAHGHQTLRKRSNDEFIQGIHNPYGKDQFLEVRNTHEDGSVDGVNMTYMDIRFSNICNMRCRSCGPDLSSQWFNDAVDSQFNKTPTQPIHQIKKGSEDFLTTFDPYLDTVEKIYWAGGEPLIMDEHWYIMNKLVDMGRTKRNTPMRIYYNTNFSKLTYKGHDAIELWKNFESVGIGASIDASGKRGEYLRKGTIWKDIVANRQRLHDEAPELNDFHVSCTVSIFNALTVMPKHLREEAQQKIDVLLEEIKDQDKLGRTTNTFQSFRSFLDGDDTHLTAQFLESVKEMDRFRKEDFFDVHPEFEFYRDAYDSIDLELTRPEREAARGKT